MNALVSSSGLPVTGIIKWKVAGSLQIVIRKAI